MARERYLVGIDEEELKPLPKQEPPKGPIKKIENFWYHYKWPCLIILVVTALAVWLGTQLFTRNEPDVRIELVTSAALDLRAIEALEHELVRYATDADGDGTVEVDVDYIWLEGSGQRDAANRGKLMTHLATGDIMFFIFDPALYESIIVDKESEDYLFFAPLTGVESSGIAENGRYYNWKGDELQRKLQSSGYPEDLLFGVRDVSGTASGKKSRELYEACFELLTAYIQGEPQQLEPSAANS